MSLLVNETEISATGNCDQQACVWLPPVIPGIRTIRQITFYTACPPPYLNNVMGGGGNVDGGGGGGRQAAFFRVPKKLKGERNLYIIWN